MNANVGMADRIARVVLGLGLVAGGMAAMPAPWNWVSAAVGVVLLVTAAMQWCPIWAVTGVRTCKLPENK